MLLQPADRLNVLTKPASVLGLIHTNVVISFDICVSGSVVYLKGEQVITKSNTNYSLRLSAAKTLVLWFMMNARTLRPPGESALFMKESFVLVCGETDYIYDSVGVDDNN